MENTNKNTIKRIHALQEDVYRKIAAGEVVERPMSVVKELVENSIDAGADQITITLENGGKELIQIVDNGIGINTADIELAFQRHTTSKIISLDDFNSLSTLGFRGEALASIAEVSKIELETSDNKAGNGVLAKFTHGKCLEKKIVSCNQGTSIKVLDLFFNFPVRKKFLKSERTELSQIVQYLEQIAMIYFNVGFTVRHNNRSIFQYSAVNTFRERIYQIFGKELFDSLKDISFVSENYSCLGLVSKINTGFSIKKYQYFFVNKRVVREKTLIAAFNAAFNPFMEKMKYAAGFLLLTLPADEVDVNIHPMKTDVRFVDQQAIFMFVKRGIEQSFSGLTSTQFVSLNSSGKNCSLPATNGYDFSKKSSPQTEDYSSYSQPQLFSAEEMQTDDFRILGQYHQSYIIVEKNDQLLIIDQHNAHERINFERLLKNFTENSIQATSPLFPIIMELTPSEKQIYDQFSAIAIEKIGFGLEPIGGQSFSITKYPSILEENDIVGMLRILLNIPEVSMTDLENFVHQAFAEIACKSAVKVNTTLHPEKMKQIVRDLWKTQNPFLCPHKRPIIKQFSLEDIERFLKRR